MPSTRLTSSCNSNLARFFPIPDLEFPCSLRFFSGYDAILLILARILVFPFTFVEISIVLCLLYICFM
ncbi:hypothetical protein KSP40_PGU006645 [Platanthera guangdongensis]|uniref:Uncharacterized protein n=1 Tax=Platanthera guangdongensis TaxID=2320717 RepID=A0ABR2LNG1_9ASPA